MIWGTRVKNICVGDTVQYSREWLKEEGEDSGAFAMVKGRVTSIEDNGHTKIATVDWGRPDLSDRVRVSKLSKVKQQGRIQK